MSTDIIPNDVFMLLNVQIYQFVTGNYFSIKINTWFPILKVFTLFSSNKLRAICTSFTVQP